MLMRQWRGVQQFAMVPPKRHVTIHKRDKSSVMMPLKKVHHLVDDNVFETLKGLLN